MKVHDQPDISGFTIFCDDIRQEIGGKVTLVGCYGADLVVPGEFPFTIPKLCFSIRLDQRREVFDPNIEIRIYLPGDADEMPSLASTLLEISPGAIAASAEKQVEGLPVSDQRVVSMRANVFGVSLVLKERGQILVRAVRQSELIRLGGIRVLSQKEMADRHSSLSNPSAD